jgi:hypothetical protein
VTINSSFGDHSVRQSERSIHNGSLLPRGKSPWFRCPTEIKILPLLDPDSEVLLEDIFKEEASFMPAQFRPSPLDFAHQPKKVPYRGGVLRASILIATVTVIGIAVLMAQNPVVLFAEVTASLVDRFGIQPATDRLTPTIESSADTQALPPIAKDALVRDEVDASKSADQNQAENSETQSEALFRQFQAWAADKDAQIEPQKPVQDASEVLQGPPARLANQSRHVRPVIRTASGETAIRNPPRLRRVTPDRQAKPNR